MILILIRGREISGIFSVCGGFTGASIISFGGEKENVRLVFSTVINPPQVHISLSQHCGIGGCGKSIWKVDER